MSRIKRYNPTTQQWEYADVAQASVHDVKINGTSIVTDGVANVPIATSNNVKGLHETRPNTGITTGANGQLLISAASKSTIDNRQSGVSRYYEPIVSDTLDYAVKAALTDGKGAEWTDAEKISAKERIGLNSRTLVATIEVTSDMMSQLGDFNVVVDLPKAVYEYYVVIRMPNGEVVTQSQWNIYFGFGTSSKRAVSVNYCAVGRGFPSVTHVYRLGNAIGLFCSFASPSATTTCSASNQIVADVDYSKISFNAYRSPTIPIGTTFEFYI